ncbi:MAG: hypothetical protein L3I99_04575 [Sulfurimonas sp.]|nr:hypothetical protein [Sulfurimonas sp.]
MQATKFKSKDVSATLELFAKKNDISVDALDFKILQTVTFAKSINEVNYIKYNEKFKQDYDTFDKMIDYHLEFKQIHIIEIFKKENSKLKLIYEVEFDDININPKILIKSNSYIPYSLYKPIDIYILLKNEIDKIKVKHNILIGIFDELYISKLKSFTKHLFTDKFIKSKKLPLIETIKPNITRHSQLLLHYDNKKNEHGISEVDAEELLAEYIKPQFGKNGLDSFGKIIDSANIGNSKSIKYDIDEVSISIKESEEKILYISKTKGYVNIVNNLMLVDHKIKKATIKRVEDTLSDSEENNIEIVISEKDYTQDSIGEGVELSSETIHIEGFVGSNSYLSATKLTIDGATHQTSKQSAKFANINRHKGTLRAHKADIKLLEGGIVHATNVNIDTCLNGTIYAKNVNIKHVKSNLKVYASDSINITLVSGEDNLFQIDPSKVSILAKKIEFIDEDIEDLKYNLEEAERHDQSKVGKFKSEIEKLITEKNNIYDSVDSASITIQKPFRGLNTIHFALKNNKNLIYKTDARHYEDFCIEVKEDLIILKPVNISIDI